MEESREKSANFIDLVEWELEGAAAARRLRQTGKRLKLRPNMDTEPAIARGGEDFFLDLLAALADIEDEFLRFGIVAVLRGAGKEAAREAFGVTQHAWKEAWAALEARLREYAPK